jgi:hypothetical protein
MEPKDQWVFFRDIDWLCPKNNRFNVDTRDFHCGYFMDHVNHSDWETIKNYPHFFFTKDELVTLLERYFTESGGEAEWRYFSLEDYREGWDLKYLRIYRTELGFVVCNSEHRALKKSLLDSKVYQDLLHTH